METFPNLGRRHWHAENRRFPRLAGGWRRTHPHKPAFGTIMEACTIRGLPDSYRCACNCEQHGSRRPCGNASDVCAIEIVQTQMINSKYGQAKTETNHRSCVRLDVSTPPDLRKAKPVHAYSLSRDNGWRGIATHMAINPTVQLWPVCK